MAADVATDEGKKLKEEFKVQAIPMFLLISPKGEVYDRWVGYGEAPDFIEVFDEAKADPTTLEARVARFEKDGTAKDAYRIGRYHEASNDVAKALEFYEKAQKLDTEGKLPLATPIFDARASAFIADPKAGKAEDVAAAADAVMAGKDLEPMEIVNVAHTMVEVAKKAEKPELAKPYITRAYEAVQKATGDEATMKRAKRNMEILNALHITGDKDKALAARKEALKEGWEKDAAQLNGLAWFMFENGIQLEEAEKYARQGIEVAKAGKEKAMILDTLAEICNARGNCDDAVTVIEQALKEEPDSKYYKEQLARFQEAAKKQKG